jgi:hypothetical protein
VTVATSPTILAQGWNNPSGCKFCSRDMLYKYGTYFNNVIFLYTWSSTLGLMTRSNVFYRMTLVPAGKTKIKKKLEISHRQISVTNASYHKCGTT